MMARKPPPSLPDVFAKPGAAPPRGTPIEELPQIAEPEAEAVIHEPEPEPEPPPPPSPPPLAVAEPVPPPVLEPSYSAPPSRPTRKQGGIVLAILAIIVSLTAPFWEDSALSLLGIRTPIGRAAELSTLAVVRQDGRTEDIAQRLTAATAQMTRQQAEFTTAMRRADQAGTMIRTMALVRLSDTLRRPMPFAAELAVVRANGTDLGDLKPLLDQIEPFAASGIPGTTQLRHDFQALLDQVQRSDGGGASSWMGSLVSWTHLRKSAPAAPEADPSLDLLQSASARLADVDVAGAVEQVGQVNELYKPVFASWMDDAQARIAADTIAEKVSNMVTQALRLPATK